MIAALLHDLGHGPFSHTFEAVQKSRNVAQRHEKWTAEIIRNPDGAIRPLLDRYRSNVGFTEQVSGLLEAEDPVDIYHAVVSSSFDADRLDYVQRDRVMTGTGAGAIDFDWLMEQLRVGEVEIEAAESDSGDDRERVPTFCLDAKALPAAEQFLLARYTLHEQVYFHKTTRCVEHMIAELLRRVAQLAGRAGTIRQTGLEGRHPLIRFFGKDGATVPNYLRLDDAIVWGAIERMVEAPDTSIASLALRLRNRDLYKALDLRSFGYDEGRQRRAARRISAEFESELRKGTVLKDDGATVGIYTQVGGDDDRAHKKLYILDAGGPREITDLSRVVSALAQKQQFTRYYFQSESDRDRARDRKKETA